MAKEVRVTVEGVDGFDEAGKEVVHFKEEILLGFLDEGLDSVAEVEMVLDEVEEAHRKGQ